jgi:hypothetical protein
MMVKLKKIENRVFNKCYFFQVKFGRGHVKVTTEDEKIKHLGGTYNNMYSQVILIKRQYLEKYKNNNNNQCIFKNEKQHNLLLHYLKIK